MIADLIRLSALYVVVRVFIEVTMPSSRLIVKYLFWAGISLTIINSVGPVAIRFMDDIHSAATTYVETKKFISKIFGVDGTSSDVGNQDLWERYLGVEWEVPTKGKITQGYEEGKHHGIDIGAKEGKEIIVTRAGRVEKVVSTPVYGLMVLVSHGGGYESLYAHCSEVLVKEMDNVLKGDEIALVGNTGRSTGPHLHFEIRVNGKTHDPAKYLN